MYAFKILDENLNIKFHLGEGGGGEIVTMLFFTFLYLANEIPYNWHCTPSFEAPSYYKQTN